jgi:hypothetical protein
MARPAFTFTGVEEVNQVLDALPQRVGPRFVRAILRKNARPLVAAAKRLSSNADVTGETTRSIGVLAARVSSGGGVAVLIGPRRGNGFKGHTAHLQEYGVKAHTITPKRRQHLSFRGRYVRSVNHPGAAAQPFMRPAAGATLGQVLDGIKRDLRLALNNDFRDVNFD